MYFKKFISSLAAAVIILAPFFGKAGLSGFGTAAYADYTFEFIDEADNSEDADDSYAENDIMEFSTNAVVNIDEEDIGSSSNYAVRSYNPFSAFMISLIIGLVCGLIGVSIMKSSMRSVHKKQGAADYRKENGFKLDVRTDSFLGKRVEKSPVMRAEAPSSQKPNR